MAEPCKLLHIQAVGVPALPYMAEPCKVYVRSLPAEPSKCKAVAEPCEAPKGPSGRNFQCSPSGPE